MTAIEQMWKLCDQARLLYEVPPKVMSQPWQVRDLFLGDWTVGTDGVGLLAVGGLLEGAGHPAPYPVVKLLGSKLAGIRHAASLDLAALRAWCGPAVWRTSCPECQGTGRKACPMCLREHECAACAGEGGRIPKPRPGRLLGLTIDRARLTCLLDGWPGGFPHVEAGLYPEPEPGDRALVLDSPAGAFPRRRALLMPIVPVSDDAEVLPEFETREG